MLFTEQKNRDLDTRISNVNGKPELVERRKGEILSSIDILIDLRIPLDNSDLIDKYIIFEKQGIKGAVNKLLQIYPEFLNLVQDKLKEDPK